MKTKKSDYPVNDRIIEKMTEAGMDESSLAIASGVPKMTVYRITKKEVKPNRSTVEQLAKALNANFLYLFTGREGEIRTGVDPWKDVALKQVASERDNLKMEVANLWDMIKAFRSGELTFLTAVKGDTALSRMG